MIDAETGERPMPAAKARRMVADALVHDRVALAFQPVVLPGPGGGVAFYEGLIRLRGDDGSPIPARLFINAVEGHEIERQLDAAALRKGLSALAEHPWLRLSVNISPNSIDHDGWIACLEAAAGRDRSVAERLIVEVTERAAIVVPRMRAFMDRVRRLGVSFALDDFGAGYTSFLNLKSLRFDIIKIDGGLVRDIDRDPGNQVMMKALLSVAEHFETLTVAEAVETPGEARMLRRLGVGCMQGWLFGRPELELAAPARQALASSG